MPKPRAKGRKKTAEPKSVYRKERGESRAIYVAVTDDPDFLALSKDGKLLWYTLKMRLGASGIDVVYPGQLADLSGIEHEKIEDVLRELDNTQWTKRERNVVWMRNGLRFDPYMSTENRMHVSAICKHLSGLPKLAIVNDFCGFYKIDPAWIIEGVPDTLPNRDPYTLSDTPTDTPTDTGGRREEVGGRRKELGGKPLEPPLSPPADPPVAEAEADADGEQVAVDGAGFIHPTKRLSASQVMQAWETQHGRRVAEADRQRHMRIARRIADHHSAEDVAWAFLGIGQLYPHSKGEPWDLSDLDRKFDKASAAARNHPELRMRQREDELLRLLEAL
jgi:hypothetical protein